MKIKFLGTGSAFIMDSEVIELPDGRKAVIVKNFQSNLLVTSSNDKKLLLDCGTDIRFALQAHGYKASDIDAVYVSHLHADHIGGLEFQGFVSYFGGTVFGKAKPIIYAQTKILQDLWNQCLQGGMDSIEEIDATLSTYFEPHAIKNSGHFDFDGIECKLIQTVHVVADSHFKPSYGLMMHDKSTLTNKKVFFTSDTQFSPSQMKKFIQSADIVFHDCETAVFASGVHAHYEELKKLPDDLKSKMWLYHYNNAWGSLPDAIADGFAGFVMPGQEFLI